jgi:hypothetical protein
MRVIFKAEHRRLGRKDIHDDQGESFPSTQPIFVVFTIRDLTFDLEAPFLSLSLSLPLYFRCRLGTVYNLNCTQKKF